jgi:diaminopimelate epimerase
MNDEPQKSSPGISFAKLHGNGNDFVLIDEYSCTLIPDGMKGQFAALYCDRRFGIGADGVLFLLKGENADLKMRLFQPDESEAEMCGNGLRCCAKFARDAGYVKDTFTVETLAGVIPVTVHESESDTLIRIRMPESQFLRPSIPATGEGDFREEIGGYTVFAVNTGVPHAVIFVDKVDAVPVAEIAPNVRHHPSFPKGANVNFVEMGSGDTLKIRTYERGVEDETLSCGTGATAAAAVAHRQGYKGPVIVVETKGGPLTISLGEETWVEGPAATVYYGIIPI